MSRSIFLAFLILASSFLAGLNARAGSWFSNSDGLWRPTRMIQPVLMPRSAAGLGAPLAPPELDLEMTGAEYERLFTSHPQLLNFTADPTQTLQPILAAGKRNLDWLKFINAHRTGADTISLTSKATQGGIPIEKARKYNPELIRKSYDELLAKLPQAFKAVVVDGAAFTVEPPLPDAQYAELGHELDKAYQMAARWFSLAPYMNYLTRSKARDIRGYYFLNKEKDLKNKLSNWSKNSVEVQKSLTTNLQSICFNTTAGICAYAAGPIDVCMSMATQTCEDELNRAMASEQVNDFYQKYFPTAEAVFKSYFEISNNRTDVKWLHRKKGEEMHVPFVDPAYNEASRMNLKSFLSDNIQDEWRWQNWHLILDFVAPQPKTPHLEFQPGATAHVNALAGDIITMDENQPLTEYDIQWTIRHEFGHVIGFPDCYLEFFEPTENVIISYQLDVNNLMCSRKGKIQQTHYDELEKWYAH